MANVLCTIYEEEGKVNRNLSMEVYHKWWCQSLLMIVEYETL